MLAAVTTAKVLALKYGAVEVYSTYSLELGGEYHVTAGLLPGKEHVMIIRKDAKETSRNSGSVAESRGLIC
jgi:hypothetical protein